MVAFGLAGILAATMAPAVAHGEDESLPDVAAELSEIVATSEEPTGLSGDEAIEALRDTDLLDTVAVEHDLEPVELETILAADSTLRLTGDGSLAYFDELPAEALLASHTDVAAEFTAPAGFSIANLESLPGVQRVLYLDFDGHVTTGDPYWNGGASPSAIVSDPYPGTNVDKYEIWRRVAEDYAPFGVNVTTKDPGVEGLRKSSPSDPAYGQRMVISPTNWTGRSGTLGIALVGVFGSSLDRPAFVFTHTLSIAHIAEAISHEAGHTFGLNHDGPGSNGYYIGHGDWAPIMGFPLSKAITQWSRGEYTGANNTEDDVAKIAGYVGYRTDDAGATVGSAKVVSCGSTTDGIIGPGDTDVFVTDVGAGALTVKLAPAEPWTNLHARVEVRRPDGTVVGTAQPATATGWSANVSASVAAGRYSIHVTPTGWETVNTGFSTYGSMGQYRLVVDGSTPGSGACLNKFNPVTPTRLLDTRRGLGGYTRLPGGTQALVQVTGRGGVPSGATAAIVNVTAVTPSGWGYLTVHPCEVARPETSNVNYVAGQVVANSTIAALSPSGQLCVWTYADADVLVDVTGWIGPGGGSRLTAVGPTRVVDTRSSIGGTRLGAGQTLTVDLSQRVPANASAVAFNLTAVGASTGGYLTAYPCGASRPDTSAVNYLAVEARPNNVMVGLGAGRRICIFSDAPTDVIVDLTGHLSTGGALSYIPTAPRRVLDTRTGVSPLLLSAPQTLFYNVTAGLPAGLVPEAAFVNVTSVDHVTEGYVTTFNCGTLPYTSTVNQRLGQVNANGAIVPLSGASRSCGYISEPAHLLVDLNGWWVR